MITAGSSRKPSALQRIDATYRNSRTIHAQQPRQLNAFQRIDAMSRSSQVLNAPRRLPRLPSIDALQCAAALFDQLPSHQHCVNRSASDTLVDTSSGNELGLKRKLI